MDIIGPERMIVDANKRKLIIKSCRSLEAKLEIKPKNDIRVKRVVKVERSLVVVAHFVLEVSIVVRGETLPNRNYLFESILLGAYSHVVDKRMPFVCVRNDRLVPLRISQHATLGRLLEFEKQDCY